MRRLFGLVDSVRNGSGSLGGIDNSGLGGVLFI